MIATHLVKDIYVALFTVIVLFGINLFFHFKVEHKRHRKDLVILSLFDIFVLSLGIWLAGQSAYFGLLQEINRHFG
jgi:uncharacterized membrane protein YoaT (DUF817 family)